VERRFDIRLALLSLYCAFLITSGLGVTFLITSGAWISLFFSGPLGFSLFFLLVPLVLLTAFWLYRSYSMGIVLDRTYIILASEAFIFFIVVSLEAFYFGLPS